MREIANYRESFKLHAETVRRYALRQCSFDAVEKSAAALKLARATTTVELEAREVTR